MKTRLLVTLIVGLLLCGYLIRRHNQQDVVTQSPSQHPAIDAWQQNIQIDQRTDYTDEEPAPSTEGRS